jgi:hypothetical protein
MITLQQFLETIEYKITEGDSYGWTCFGPNSHQLGSWNGIHGAGGWSANIVFSTKSQKVYCVEVCDYTNDRAYRLINPKYRDKYDQEVKQRGSQADQAWDDVDYTDLETDADFTEKAQAIVAVQDYDTRISVPVDFTDEEILKYAMLAHEKDITLNQFIEQALRDFMEHHKLPNDD